MSKHGRKEELIEKKKAEDVFEGTHWHEHVLEYCEELTKMMQIKWNGNTDNEGREMLNMKMTPFRGKF